jgi:phosphoribosylformimino-5-aminoimidazole carboxamide ribotide isomerase
MTKRKERAQADREERPGRRFLVVPAIDVLDGRCVRLAGGDPTRVTLEIGDPVQAAARLASEGAPILHLVDLDGALSGSPSFPLLARIVEAAGSTPVQVGGGYRTHETIEVALAAGAARVMVGTAALEPSFLDTAAARFGERLVVAVDAREGRVAREGWTETTEVTPAELGRRCAETGVRRLLVTSATRDGSLSGPDVDLLRTVRDASGLPILAAGGIASLDDLRLVRNLGCEGVVLGSALWSGRVELAKALRVASEPVPA